MKKLFIAGVLGLMAGVAYAACVGPFCWDDQGASVAGAIMDGNGTGMVSLTAAQVLATKPRAVGQEIWCSDCVSFNAAKGMLCISTGTAAAASYMAVSSATAISACK